MSSVSIREPASFGKRQDPHKIIVVRNGRERQFNINPLVFSVLAGTLFMFLFGYFGATAYLVFRDDLIASSYARNARIQHEYEDRIAALRSKLDRVTSRQLLDQQAIENRVRELMERQQIIGARGGSMQEMLDEARKRGLSTTAESRQVPVPESNPIKTIDTDTVQTGSITPVLGDSAGLALKGSINLFTPESTAGGTQLAALPLSAYDTNNPVNAGFSFTREIFGDVEQAIGIIDAKQREEIDSIRIAAAERASRIGDVLKSIGVKVSTMPETDVGGPFVPLDHSVEFNQHLEALEQTLKTYDNVTSVAKAIPLGAPVPGAKMSSRYGSRVDPFNGRVAMHGGIDFKAKRGTPVHATASGKIIRAGRNGGYGKVVEIQHPNGYTTRYAHLSKINVKVGQKITKGTVVGKVGSTGRSTGPHLHYEVRKSNKTRDPAKYVRAGYKMRGLL